MTSKPDHYDSESNDPISAPNRGRYRGEHIEGQYQYNGYNGYAGSYNGTSIQKDDDDEIDIKQIIGLLWHHKYLIVTLIILGGVGAWFYADRQIPIYESDGSLQVMESSVRTMAGSDLSNLLTTNFGVGAGNSVDNVINVLRSRTFASELAQRVYDERYQSNGDIFPVLWTDYPEDPTVVDVEVVFGRLLRGMVFNRVDRNSNIIRVSYRSPSPYEAARIVDFAIDTYTDLSTRINRSQAGNAMAFLESELGKISTQLRESEERYRTFMDENRLVQLDTQSNEVIRALSTLEAEKQSIQVQMVAVNSKLNASKAELDQITPGMSSRITAAIAPRISQLQFVLAERETQKTLLISRNPELRNNPNDPSIRELDQQIRGIQEELNSLSSELMSSDAGLSVLNTTSSDGNITSRFLDLRNQVLALEIDKLQFDAQVEQLDQRIAEYQSSFDRLPDNIVEMARYRRDLEMNESLFRMISEQTAQTALWEQTQNAPATVVDRSFVPTRPVSPNRLIILIIGIGLGGVVAVGFVSIREYMRSEITSIDKLVQKGYQVLAVIPDMRKHVKEHFKGADAVNVKGRLVSTELTMALDSISPISEAYRRLQSNVIYAHKDEPLKTIIVTSANKSEGKTTVSSNLAIALAESGKTVLLIDCDFRRPRVHGVFGTDQEPGVMDVYLGNALPEMVIQASVVPRVHILTTGKRPANPAEVNRSQKLRDIIRELKGRYDHIVIDSPPFGIISDAAPLIQESDGVILVCKFNQTLSPELDITIANLSRVQANVLGTVMTSFDPKKSTGYYYTNYYYKYAYESYDKYHAD